MMKNILIFLSLFLACSHIACSDDKVEVPQFVGMEIKGEDLLSGDTLYYDTTSRTSLLRVVVSGEWNAEITENIDWCGVTRSAIQGVNDLKVNVYGNNNPDERVSNLRISGGNTEKNITIYQLGSKPALKVAPSAFTALASDSATIRFRVITNVPVKVTITEGEEWILPLEQSSVDTMTYRYAIRENGTAVRSGKIEVKQVDGSLIQEIPLFQQARSSEYEPGDPNSLGEPVKQTVTSATAVSPLEPDNNDYHFGSAVIANSFDNNYATQYNSKEAREDAFPITLTYNLAAQSKVDYINYYPRSSGSNGHFGRFTLEYKVGNGSFQTYGDFDFKEKATLSTIMLNETLENVTAVRFIVYSGSNDFVACGEMEFYQRAPKTAAADLFTDLTCSALKPEVTRAQIQGVSEDESFLKQIALALYDGHYPLERVATYQPYLPVGTLSNRLKTSNYNIFENPTGVYFSEGERAVIFVEHIAEPVSLCVVDWSEEGNERRTFYTLLSGTNVISIAHKGLGYISYFHDNYTAQPDIRVHIASGKVNGVFDLERGDQNAYWTSLLENTESADCKILDIRGKYVQLAFDKASLKANNLSNGREMIQEYDNAIKFQQDLMGVDKYGWRTTNRMFARRSYGGNPNANGLGVSFPSLNVKPDNIRNNSWEIQHEFGHVNQVRPGMKWQGTTEVTNNIFAAAGQFYHTPNELRLEHESVGDGEGAASMVGNRFNCYFNNGIIKGQNWLFQMGQNKPNPETGAGDLFVRAIPFWQLYLYNEIAGLGVKEFYPQIFELVRNTNDTDLTDKDHHLNFMRNVCHVMQTDMTLFLEKCGMLKPYNHEVSDYGGAKLLEITEAEVEAFKNEIQALGYKQPLTNVVNYISGNSIDAYKNKLAVQGTTGVGVSGTGASRIVAASQWQNVVAFETYAGEELVKLALPFTNYKDRSATHVLYPDGATRIEAVAWDGTRTLVYGER
ncbi:MAG: M60 family metallopeptidase [Marinifilaceae bacterium]